MMATEDTPVKERQDRRHPLVVTSTRLADHQVSYQAHITPAEQLLIVQLTEIVDRVHRRVTGEDLS